MKNLLFVSFVIFGTVSFADEVKSPTVEQVNKDFDALGGNRELLDKAIAVRPEIKAVVVQNRMVSRDKRFEIAPEYSGNVVGNPYYSTQNIGLNVNYHINPRWSLGAKYAYSFNTLTPEGQSAYDKAMADLKKNPNNPTVPVPELDFPKSEALALVNWYPIYGKMNLIDKMVAHFDMYLIGGGGQIELKSGTTSTWTAGGGFGVWWTPHLSSRLEARYQTYSTKLLDQDNRTHLVVGSLQMGWML